MPGSFTHDLNRWRQGDSDAQFDLERRLLPFLQELIRGIRRRRSASLNARIDSHGVVYEALNSFLTGIQKNEFPDLGSREDAKRLLRTMVLRTLNGEIRWHRRGKRTPTVEVQAEQGQPVQVPATADITDAIASWLEEFEVTVRSVHEKAIDIVDLTVRGYSNNDIAHELGLGLRTVQLIVQRMIDRWKS